jgi:epoxide hydrolase-like predicted phosphatase
LRQRFRGDPSSRELLIKLETGELDEDEFEPRFAEILGVKPQGLIERIFAGAGPDEAMLSAVQHARKRGVRTGLISNSWGTRRYDRELLSRLFYGIVISGEVGIRKPSPEIYELAAESVGLPPSACVFVDDLPFNLKPAAALGMATVHHAASEQTISELEELLGVELR